jgi:hypothetical protein
MNPKISTSVSIVAIVAIALLSTLLKEVEMLVPRIF